MKCEHCGRPIREDVRPQNQTHHLPASYAVINHTGYGCDTGCCGYQIVTYDKYGTSLHTKFDFSHPYIDEDDAEKNRITELCHQWAKELVEDFEPNTPIKWEYSTVTNEDCY